MYTTQEKIQIVEWVLTGNSVRRTAELFSVYFEARPIPSISTIHNIVKTFRTTGCLNNDCRGNNNRNDGMYDNIGTRNYTEDDEVNILAAVEVNPNISVRSVARELGLDQSYIHRMLKKHKYHAYKYSKHQELLPQDEERRNYFCENMLERCNANANFLSTVCFTDECTFTLNGEPNTQNYRYWATQNPHVYVASHTQYRQSVNVWAGIFKDTILGPFFIDGTLTGEKYLDLLITDVCPALAELAEDDEVVWFQQDGAPAHYHADVRNFLNHTFVNSWIGRGGPVEWPARSPDLSPNDFFLWGHLKSTIYTARRHQNIDSLKDSITEACFNVPPTVIQAVRQNFYNRSSHCLIENGNLFEHLLN